jgi:hypothetical protein
VSGGNRQPAGDQPRQHSPGRRFVVARLAVLNQNPAMPSRDQLAESTAWCGKPITGDEKGQAQIFLDRPFQL